MNDSRRVSQTWENIYGIILVVIMTVVYIFAGFEKTMFLLMVMAVTRLTVITECLRYKL